METYDLSLLKAADFDACRQQPVQICFEAGITLRAKLVQITEFDNFSPLERKPFSVIFQTTPSDKYYLQGTYPVRHPALPDLAVFLVPLGADADGMKYEAIFS